MAAKLLLCDCAGTQNLDREAIEAATGLPSSRIHSALCTREAEAALAALADGAEIVACGQEAETFDALADEAGLAPLLAVDIRDRAGWSEEGAAATPKIAALLAAARRPRPASRAMDVTSEGRCLIVGAAEAVLPVAELLAERLSVTALLSDSPDIAWTARRRFDLHRGRLRSVTGSFGAFSVTVDGFQEGLPAGRGAPSFAAPRDGGRAACDILLDLRGEAPAFAKWEERDGYLWADPARPAAALKAAMTAADLVGRFEKTLHVRLEATLCAHARAEKTGCTRCLSVCPTGAITPNGEAVQVDPAVCAGCGGCAAVCPSGAISYDDPPVAHIFGQLSDMAAAYRKAGGGVARLLVHDAGHGREMIALAARFGRGLPADVIPLEVSALAAFGHAEMLAALGVGFGGVDLLMSPTTERDAPEREVALAAAILAGTGGDADALRLIAPTEPDGLSETLYGRPAGAALAAPILPLGGRREVTRLAAKALAQTTPTAPIPLPDGAPYGAVLVDAEACTLCHACASLCPSGALSDNPDKPELLFREDACLQCGLCQTICPEAAITLKPELDLSDAALREQVMKAEEPYACIECGKLFGVKSTIEKIVATLENKHPMFTLSDNARLIRMCDDCRVAAQYHSEAAPFQSGERRPVRTTADYLSERDADPDQS